MALAERDDADGQAKGDLLIWILFWGELLICAALLASRPAGLGTAMLLLSGWFAARAVRAESSVFFCRVRLPAAGSLGLLFAGLMIAEYRQQWPIATLPDAGTFFGAYRMLTGYHRAHVVFLAGLLLLLAFRKSTDDIRRVATLWHVTDLVWLAIFPLVNLS